MPSLFVFAQCDYLKSIVALVLLLSPTTVFCKPEKSCSRQHLPNSADNVGTHIVASAHSLMNKFYQNPEASKLPPYSVLENGEHKGYGRAYNPRSKGKNSFITNPQLARASQYYVDCSGEAQNRPKICEFPPSYVWGGMGRYETSTEGERKSFKFNPFSNHDDTNQLSRHPGMDCSGLIYASFAAAGLRVKPGKHDLSEDDADATVARSYLKTKNAQNEDSCFSEVKPEKKGHNNSYDIQQGDLIPSSTHIVMVDEVGKDPFGLASIKGPDDCTIANIDPSKFTMVIFHSKGGSEPSGKKGRSNATNIYQKNKFYRQGKEKLKQMESATDPSAPQLTGVGIGISRMKLSEMAVFAPQVVFGMALKACRAKFGLTAPQSEAPFKVIRHLAATGSAPCSCVVEPTQIQTTIDLKTASTFRENPEPPVQPPDAVK